MRPVVRSFAFAFCFLVACSSSDDDGAASAAAAGAAGSAGAAGASGTAGAAGAAGSAGAAGATGGNAGAGGNASSGVRGQRYCEILLATPSGAQLHVDVYNTFLLNDCPQDTWSKVDAAQVAKDASVTLALLNGPRYWLMDGFEGSSLKDPTVKTLGGIEMRLAGKIDLPLADAMANKPYTPRTIQRDTTVRFDAGKTIFELTGPDGGKYVMQSYSTQKAPQTEADLSSLGGKLTLPAGWSFAPRTLTDALHVTAVGGLATVVQDDLENTYQREQPLHVDDAGGPRLSCERADLVDHGVDGEPRARARDHEQLTHVGHVPVELRGRLVERPAASERANHETRVRRDAPGRTEALGRREERPPAPVGHANAREEVGEQGPRRAMVARADDGGG